MFAGWLSYAGVEIVLCPIYSTHGEYMHWTGLRSSAAGQSQSAAVLAALQPAQTRETVDGIARTATRSRVQRPRMRSSRSVRRPVSYPQRSVAQVGRDVPDRQQAGQAYASLSRTGLRDTDLIPLLRRASTGQEWSMPSARLRSGFDSSVAVLRLSRAPRSRVTTLLWHIAATARHPGRGARVGVCNLSTGRQAATRRSLPRHPARAGPALRQL